MKRALAFFLTFFMSVAHSQEKITGNDWIDVCSSKDKTTKTFCALYFGGLIDGVNINSDIFKTEKVFCFPESGTPYQAVDIFVKYLRDHPEERHKDLKVVSTLSMINAFPCKKVSKFSTQKKKEDKRIKEMY